MFKVVNHAIDLIEVAFFVAVFYAELITVRLADRAVCVRPRIPDMRREIVNVIALFLPDPENFVERVLKIRLSYRNYRKLVAKVVAVDDTKLLYRVRWSSVLPMRADGQILVRKPVVDNVAKIR